MYYLVILSKFILFVRVIKNKSKVLNTYFKNNQF